jgi:hypothetical protein
VKLPSLAGQLYRTQKLMSGPFNLVRIATGIQNPPIERRIVGGDRLCPSKQRFHLRPKLPEGGFVDHVLPVNPVNVGEFKIWFDGPYQKVCLLNNLKIFNPNNPDGASTLSASACSFKINGNKGFHKVLLQI